MSDLPGDLLEEIFCRVPATSLKQLRSTCKQWNNLFNNRRFARKHFHKATKQHMYLMLTQQLRVCSASVDLHEVPSIKIISEISLNNSLSNPPKYKIRMMVFHCQGLLLCAFSGDTRIFVWNPCTGQTKCIQPRSDYKTHQTYSLGSYQGNKPDDNSYKILSIGKQEEFVGYELNNSNSWRILDFIPDFKLLCNNYMSMKGKTYWFARDEKEKQLGVFLVSFDYTTERFEHLIFPFLVDGCLSLSLSIVREKKLSVLFQRTSTWEKEIWVTNKIDETRVVSWTKVLTLNYPKLGTWISLSCFLVDEEKKIIIVRPHGDIKNLYIVGRIIKSHMWILE